MDTWSPTVLVAALAVLDLLGVFCHEVTVRDSDLQPCKDNDQVCVTDLGACGPGSPSSIWKTLNMSCHHLSYSSLTCELSQESNSLDITLVFRSRNKIFSCKHIFNPSAVLKVTARVWDYVTRTEVWSQPHTVVLYQAVKASQPVLSVLGFTDDSVNVSWTSSVDGSCRLRYRASDTGIWSQPAGLVAVRGNQVSVQTITGLLPLTTYTAAVACRRGESGIWSSWSLDVTVTTLERAPSRPPEVCYRVEGAASRRPQLLHLSFWKGPDHETRGRVLGYQVSHEPAVRQCLQDRMILNATEVTAPLVVEEGNCSVTVTAFNTAGAGPAAQLSVDTHAHGLSSVRNLWISSSLPDARALNVQWESPAAPTATPTAPPVSHFVVRWQSERRPSTSCWSTVDSVNTSTHIPDVDPDESYLVSVFPVYKQQLCGAVQSLPATLQQGALMEVVGLKVVALTKTLVTVEWAWQRASRGPIRVNRYEVMLQERQKTVGVVTVWPDQSQHSFTNLKPDTEYSLLLLADDFPRSHVAFRTRIDEVVLVATATPLLLLLLTVLVTCILSRTVYRSYFFPRISSPRGSTTGRWLMDPEHQSVGQKRDERVVLDIRDFQVTDVVGEKSVIVVGPKSRLRSDEDPGEDVSLLPLSHLIIKLSSLELDATYISDAAPPSEQPLPPPPLHPDYAMNCHHPDEDVGPEGGQEAAAAPPPQVCDANSPFPHKEEEDVDLPQTSALTTAKHPLHELMTNADRTGDNQMSCEVEYLRNSWFQGNSHVTTVSGRTDSSYLVCDSEYIANSCFTAAAAEDRATDSC